MSKKGKTAKAIKKKEDYPPIYIQSSNPTKALLDWIEEISEERIVYLQSGNPPKPPNCPPGGCQ